MLVLKYLYTNRNALMNLFQKNSVEEQSSGGWMKWDWWCLVIADSGWWVPAGSLHYSLNFLWLFKLSTIKKKNLFSLPLPVFYFRHIILIFLIHFLMVKKRPLGQQVYSRFYFKIKSLKITSTFPSPFLSLSVIYSWSLLWRYYLRLNITELIKFRVFLFINSFNKHYLNAPYIPGSVW